MTLSDTKKIKGYSHEEFKKGKKTIYKFTKDSSRYNFVMNQHRWLKSIQDKFPQYSFNNLYLIDKPGEVGYSMECVDYKKVTEANAKDLVQIVYDLKIPADKINEVLSWNVNMNVKPLDNGFEIMDFNLMYENYVKYLKRIVLSNPDIFNCDWYEYESQLMKYVEFANNSLSFYHGDFTIDNILWDGKKYTLIDPNFKSNMWGSYLLDLSKLYQETRFDENGSRLFFAIQHEIMNKFKFSKWEMTFLDLLEIGHYIRMIPYVIKYPDIYQIKLCRLQQLFEKQKLT